MPVSISSAASTIAPTEAPATDNSAPIVDTPVIPDSKANEAFARKERQIRKMQQDLQMQKQALEAKQRQYETDYVPKARLKEDPWSVLQEQGFDYDQLTQQILQQPNDPATKALMQKVRAMEERLSRADQTQQEQQKAAVEQAKKQIANDAKLIVDGGGDEFELLKNAEMYDEVVKRIEDEFYLSGTVRDTKEVCMELENELIEDMVRFAKLQKVQSRLMPKTEPALAVPQKPGMKTISQQMQPSTPSRLSAKDRTARAVAAFRGELK